MRWIWLAIWISVSTGCLLAQARIESEYKIAVPSENADEVWQFLQSTFAQNQSNIFSPQSETRSATEIFYDTYFDDSDKSLYQKKAGARYRERYVKDSLLKTLLQLKVPTIDKLGIARKEHKFSSEDKKDITDRNGLHPFLKYVKQNDLADVDLVLGQFGTSAIKMNEALKLKQIRRRVYVSDERGALMTFTLDDVSSFHFPYTRFVELELELNEIRYTDADYIEKEKMEKMNAAAKQTLFDKFDNLVQDQTPKYNKMYDALNSQPIFWVYDNVMCIILGLISVFAFSLILQNKPRFANT